jgi:predicted ester cyclase
MSAERNIDIARIFHEAWNDPDPERGAAVIAPDCQFVDVPRSEKLIGPDGYRRDYYRWRMAFPDGRVEIVNVIAAGDDVVVEFINRGTNTGPISTTTALRRQVGQHPSQDSVLASPVGDYR